MTATFPVLAYGALRPRARRCCADPCSYSEVVNSLQTGGLPGHRKIGDFIKELGNKWDVRCVFPFMGVDGEMILRDAQ